MGGVRLVAKADLCRRGVIIVRGTTFRHPGLVPGSTGPQGGGRRLQPPPSPQSGPRNKSGVTEWVGLGFGPNKNGGPFRDRRSLHQSKPRHFCRARSASSS
ncbi:hypothetical protein D9602_13505 [Sphingomonas sp. TX0522]|nr:hypothetical protein [Sphingomonas sp. TX0522]